MIRNNRNLQGYLRNAQRNANEVMRGVDGQIDSDLYFTNEQGRGFFPADGSQTAAPAAPQSQPYIIIVSNASAAGVANFDVLGAYTYLANPPAGGVWAGGSFTFNGITLSSGIAGVSYQQILNVSQFQPFTVGKTYFYSVAGSAAQVVQPFNIFTGDANGNQAQKTVIPRIDPYQYQSTALIIPDQYRIDGYTKLIFSQILASVVFQIHIFPVDNINLSRGLNGDAVSRQFTAPAIAKGLGL